MWGEPQVNRKNYINAEQIREFWLGITLRDHDQNEWSNKSRAKHYKADQVFQEVLENMWIPIR